MMNSPLILAIDQGTTNTKALIVNSEGAIVTQSSQRLSQRYPYPGWVEQDPNEIWQSVQNVVNQVLQPGINPIAIAITNQRETIVCWDRKTGKPLAPAVVWQCRRSEPLCQSLREQGVEPMLRERTGLTLDPLFPAAKMRWLLENVPEASQRAQHGELCFGTMDSWIIWNLTGGAVHAADCSNASRTQLFSLQKLSWDPELLRIFDIPQNTLPEIKPSSGLFGETVKVGSLPAGIPIASAIGDSHGALYGQCGFQDGTIKATYGTGSSLMIPLPHLVLSSSGLSTTVAWRTQHQTIYALEGNIAVCGAAIEWLGEFLGFQNAARDVSALAERANAEWVRGNLYFVPAFVGLGAPHWDSQTRGQISGLTRGSSAADLALATLDSLAYQVRDIFDPMQQEGKIICRELLVDGGVSANDSLMQFQADILGCSILRNRSSHIAPLGAAYLAGLAMGIWRDQEQIIHLQREFDRFEPKMNEQERNRLYSGWQEAVNRAKSTP